MPSAVSWLLDSDHGPAHAPLRAGPALRREALSAMRRDGLVVHVAGGVYLPADAVGSGVARALAVAELVPRGGVVGLISAAWLLGAPIWTGEVDVLFAHRRGPVAAVDGVRLHRTTLPPSDVTTLAPVRLTTAARTAADLARADDDASLTALQWLLARRVTEREVLAVLRVNQRYRHNRRAKALLRRLRAARSAV